MPERSGKLLLIILCLLPGSVISLECTLADTFEVLSCPSFCQNTSDQFLIGSANCGSGLSTRVSPTSRLGPVLDFSLYIILDLAPLIVYFPVLIIFNINLASGPGQSFLFFYHAVTASTDSDIYWGFLIMQNPINDLIFPRTLPYIALEYCKLAAVLVAIVMTVVLVKCIHCPCASWRHPWAKLRRCVRNFREKRALNGTVLNGLSYSHTALSFNKRSLFSDYHIVVHLVPITALTIALSWNTVIIGFPFLWQLQSSVLHLLFSFLSSCCTTPVDLL